MCCLQILKKRHKHLSCEDIPLSAQFWEMAINLIYVKAAVLRAGLNDVERIELVKKFNDSKSILMIFIIMHPTSSQVNLDTCYSKVLIVTNAKIAPQKWQC